MRSAAYNRFGVLMGTSSRASRPRWLSLRGNSLPMITLISSQGDFCATASVLVRHWPDLCIIVVLLVANAAVGFWEEYQAGNAIAALKAKLALQARVKRDGRWTTVAARALVPGDIIRLRLGDIV